MSLEERQEVGGSRTDGGGELEGILGSERLIEGSQKDSSGERRTGWSERGEGRQRGVQKWHLPTPHIKLSRLAHFNHTSFIVQPAGVSTFLICFH